ncbi:MAG: AEC family transporter [Oscillospiraceae bacterium]
MDLGAVITQMEVLFIILAIGYIVAKIGVFDETMVSSLSKFFSAIVFPSLIINSILGGSASITGNTAVFYLLLAVLSLVILIPIIFVTPYILRTKKEHSSVYRFMIICVNIGFVGYPVAQAAYGEESFFYLGLFMVVGTLYLFTFGIVVLTEGEGKLDIKALLKTPVLIITVVSFILFLFGFKLPSPLYETCSTLAQVAVPLGMLIVGATLGALPVKDVFTEWRLYPFSIIKLILIPVVTWLILRMFTADKLILGTLVITSAVPAASLCPIIARQYGKDEVLSAKGVFLTTVLSMLTMPVLLFVLKLL